MRRFLGGLRARHDFAVNTSIGFSREVIHGQDLDGANAAGHPVVRTHGDTERKCLFVNPGNTSYLEGLEPRESVKLLEFLYGHCTQPEFIYRHRWSSNDLIIWDNLATFHSQTEVEPYVEYRRLMFRAYTYLMPTDRPHKDLDAFNAVFLEADGKGALVLP